MRFTDDCTGVTADYFGLPGMVLTQAVSCARLAYGGPSRFPAAQGAGNGGAHISLLAPHLGIHCNVCWGFNIEPYSALLSLGFHSVPGTVTAHISLLAPHLGGRTSSLRSATVTFVGVLP